MKQAWKHLSSAGHLLHLMTNSIHKGPPTVARQLHTFLTGRAGPLVAGQKAGMITRPRLLTGLLTHLTSFRLNMRRSTCSSIYELSQLLMTLELMHSSKHMIHIDLPLLLLLHVYLCAKHDQV